MTTEQPLNGEEAPYFIRIRGCINCETSKTHKRNTGDNYGFDHELVIACIIRGCFDQGHDLANPYIDPAEIVRVANEVGTPKAKKNARRKCLEMEATYRKFYKIEGLSVDSILEGLGTKLA